MAGAGQPGLPPFQLEVTRMFFTLPASRGFLLAGPAGPGWSSKVQARRYRRTSGTPQGRPGRPRRVVGDREFTQAECLL